MTEEYPPGTQDFPLHLEDTEDILSDYLSMADWFSQDDKDVKDYREELEHRGFLFITEYDDEVTPLGEEGTILVRDPRTGMYPSPRSWEV